MPTQTLTFLQDQADEIQIVMLGLSARPLSAVERLGARSALRIAVSNWRDQDTDGQQTWTTIGENFNIGNLLDQIGDNWDTYQHSDNLSIQLSEVGFTRINVLLNVNCDKADTLPLDTNIPTDTTCPNCQGTGEVFDTKPKMFASPSTPATCADCDGQGWQL